MIQWQQGRIVLAIVLAVAASASVRAQEAHLPGGRLRVVSVARKRRMPSACSGTSERMAPNMTAMLGKPVTLSTASLDVLAMSLKLDTDQKKRIDAVQGETG